MEESRIVLNSESRAAVIRKDHFVVRTQDIE